MSGTIVGTKLFTLSFDKHNLDSIFTLGDLDERYVAADYTTLWAELIKDTHEWGVYAQTIEFAGKSFASSAEVLIRESDWKFELALPVFNTFTNIFHYHNPQFNRDQNLAFYYQGPCPTFDDLVFTIAPSVQGADPVQLVVTSEEYLAYSNGYCDLLFRTSPDKKTRLGLSLLEKYVVSFDSENERVGFTERDYSSSE